MATAFSSDASASNKSYSSVLRYSPPVLVAGLVQHALVTGSTQLDILRIVDETGSTTIGDIAEGLINHPDPTGAVLVMVDLCILEIEPKGVIDANTVVRRAPEAPDPLTEHQASSTVVKEAVVDTVDSCEAAGDLPVGIERLSASNLAPCVMVATVEARRALGKVAVLDRPGVYALIGDSQVYIGASSSVGNRVASGQQPIADVKTIVVITDQNDTLSGEDALAAERMFFSRVEASRSFATMNERPLGASVDAERYSDIDAFLGQACLTLRHHGVLFTEGTARSVLAGPRNEWGRVAPIRPFNDIPSGDVVELCFDNGLVALAARQSDRRWLLLQGSDVRIDTALSANSSVRFLRSAWLHAGLLELSADGRSYVTTRDIPFGSGSGAAQFCCGSKGRTRDSWIPINPEGGFDPATAALIAA